MFYICNSNYFYIRIVFVSLLLLLGVNHTFSKTHIVSIYGLETNNGTLLKPYNLKTVFNENFEMQPGDTILLRGGVYKGKYECFWKGTQKETIIIMSYPGEWAIIQGCLTLHRSCKYVTFFDFEITTDYSDTVYRVSLQPHSYVNDISTKTGFYIGAGINLGIKVINLVIHDVVGDGMAIWVRAINTEAYGNIIYNNGWDGPDRGHGHGIYTQNDTGLKILEDNICFWNLGSCGIKIYTEYSTTQNYYLEGNIHLQDGWFLIGGYKPVKNITLIDNYMGENSKISLGYNSLPNNNLVAKGNYLQNASISKWRNIELKNNNFFESFSITLPDNATEIKYKVDSNNFYNISNVTVNNKKSDFTELSNIFQDKHTQANSAAQSANKVIVRPNKYEKGRANIIIYNFKKEDKVKVNLTGVLQKGDEFEIKDIQNFMGNPVIRAKYTGEPVFLPMNLKEVDAMKGDFKGCYHPKIINHVHSSISFGVFVVRKIKRGNQKH